MFRIKIIALLLFITSCVVSEKAGKIKYLDLNKNYNSLNEVTFLGLELDNSGSGFSDSFVTHIEENGSSYNQFLLSSFLKEGIKVVTTDSLLTESHINQLTVAKKYYYKGQKNGGEINYQPNFLNSFANNYSTKYGFYHFIEYDSYMTRHADGGFGSTEFAFNFTSFLIDLEEKQIVNYYESNNRLEGDRDSAQRIIECYILSLKYHKPVRSTTFSVIDNWKNDLEVTLENGSILIGEVKYVGNLEIEVSTTEGDVRYHLGNDVLRIRDNQAGRNFFPTDIK